MKLSLNLEEVTALSKAHNVIPVHASFVLDMDTPVSLYIRSGAWQKDYSFLLESVVGGENRGRYSFIGISPYGVVKGRNSVFKIHYPDTKKKDETIKATDPLKALSLVSSRFKLFQPDELSGFYAGLLGFFSYDIIRYYEPVGSSPKAESKDRALNPLQADDMIYVIPELMIWLDHTAGSVRVIRNLFLPSETNPASDYENAQREIAGVIDTIHSGQYEREYQALEKPQPGEHSKIHWKCNTTEKAHFQMIKKAKSYIRAGDIFQVVLAKRFYREYKYDPFFLYRGLRVTNPSPYMFYLNFPELVMIGSSPEILVKKQGERITLRPIAGTIRRGKNSKEDRALGETLLRNPKERAEHIMLVDLGRNDLGRICKFGSIHVDEYMVIEKYSHVMHIVSNLMGQLKEDQGSFESIWASFPAGTVSGAPKVRAMQIIEELEKQARGPYGGCIGYFNFNGDMDTAITLRTMWVKEGVVYVQAGGGIVFDSSPDAENDEVRRKSQALFRAVETFYRGELGKQ